MKKYYKLHSMSLGKLPSMTNKKNVSIVHNTIVNTIVVIT